MVAHQTLVKLTVSIAVLAAPFVLWLALYVTARYWSLSLRSTLRWIRALQWVAWGSASLMMLIHLAHEGFPSFYAIGMLSASIGLQFPERWVWRRFAPDLMPSEGWWPRTPE